MDDRLLRFFGFTRPPFGPIDAPEKIFWDPSRADLVQEVVNDVLAGSVVISIRGGHGVGKSSLAKFLAAELEVHKLAVIQIADALQGPLAVQRHIGEALSVEGAATMRPDQLLRALSARSGVPRIVLLFDDADALPVNVFRYLQLLIQLFDSGMVHLSIVLFGGFGEWVGLDCPDLERLRTFMNPFKVVYSLHEPEAAAYLDHKLRGAGQPLRTLMTKSAVAELLNRAVGNPARLDALMEQALLHGYRLGKNRITLKRLQEATCNDFAVEPPPARPFGPTAAVAAVMSVVVVASLLLWRNPPDPETGSAAKQQVATVDSLPEASPLVGSHSDQPSEALAAAALSDLPVAPPADAAPEPAVTSSEPPQLAMRSGSQQEPSPDRTEVDSVPTVPQPSNVKPEQHSVAEPTVQLSSGRGGPGLVLVAQAGDSMKTLYARIYRGVTPPPFAMVVAANRAPLRPGAILIFPEPPEGWSAHSTGTP